MVTVGAIPIATTDHQPSQQLEELTSLQRSYTTRRAAMRSRETTWGWARLGSFALAAAIWYPLGQTPEIALAAVLAGLGLFSFTVSRHRRTVVQRKLCDRELLMLEEALTRLTRGVVLTRERVRPQDSLFARHPSQPTDLLQAEAAEHTQPARPDYGAVPYSILDDGPIWSLTGQERDDLDFYSGPVGVFGLLNRNSSPGGARRLRNMLENPMLAAAHIKARQQSVRALHDDPPNRIAMMAAVAELRDYRDGADPLVSAVANARPLQDPLRLNAIRVWGLVSAVLVTLALIGLGFSRMASLWILVPILVVNGAIYSRLRADLDRTLKPWKTLTNLCATADRCVRVCAAAIPQSDELILLQEAFEPADRKGDWRRLSRLTAWADVGGFFHVLFNVVFFYDLHVAVSILNVAVPRREVLLRSGVAIADIDALNSLASFAYEESVNGAAWPELKSETVVNLAAARHPLLPASRAVANDLSLNPTDRLHVITGSNMAGKSTYLRTTALCTIFAQMGTMVPARGMTFQPVRLVTDLQARDNLAGDESYFLAEVRHVARMVNPPDGASAPILGMLDEPFRGTNSTEKVAAALAVAEHLVRSGHLFLIATHEQELARWAEQAEFVSNYHFHENLGATGMTFDYRLRSGPARSRNALLVLEREGYPADLMDRARDWSARLERREELDHAD